MSRTRLGVVVALAREARVFHGASAARAHRDQTTHVQLEVSGIGPRRAAAAAHALLAQGCRALACIGLAGGLDPSLAPGTLVLPCAVAVQGEPPLSPDRAWRESLRAAIGSDLPLAEGLLVSVPRVASDPAAKRELAASGALAVDMESGAVAVAARAAGVPFLALRVVCDTATQALPRAALSAVDERGQARWGALLIALARAPAELPLLVALSAHSRAAERALGAALRRVGIRLALP